MSLTNVERLDAQPYEDTAYALTNQFMPVVQKDDVKPVQYKGQSVKSQPELSKASEVTEGQPIQFRLRRHPDDNDETAFDSNQREALARVYQLLCNIAQRSSDTLRAA